MPVLIQEIFMLKKELPARARVVGSFHTKTLFFLKHGFCQTPSRFAAKGSATQQWRSLARKSRENLLGVVRRVHLSSAIASNV